MKKLLSSILSITMIIVTLSASATASSIENARNVENLDYQTIKLRVSNIYGIPLDIVEHLDEARVRKLNADVAPDATIFSSESYVRFEANDQGESKAIPCTEQQYLEYLSTPVLHANPGTVDVGWMKVYLIIIDDKSGNIDISSTYTWLQQPRVIADQYDVITMWWENGSYLEGEGFYSYQLNGKYIDEDILDSDLVLDYKTFKSINYAHKMNDSGARKNEFFHIKITLDKNTGLGIERASTIYAHQEAKVNWKQALGDNLTAQTIAASFCLEGTAISFITALYAVFGNIERYYIQTDPLMVSQQY